MNAPIFITDILDSENLSDYFFRDQALDTLNELLERAIDYNDALSILDRETENEELDDIEEMFYSDTVEELARYFGIKLKDEDEDN